jgi:peptidoglycan L-alanyl-D-glutamate endopeptidase CwlK
MAADLNQLEPVFRDKMIALYADLKNTRGYEFRPVFTTRSPWAQARLWRQSRTAEEIEKTYQHLADQHAPFLVKVLRDVGPQSGRWATNALPGLSWHNWKPARACDSVLIYLGKMCWDERETFLSPSDKPKVVEAYALYASLGEQLGLKSLAAIHDIGHLQLDHYEIPHLHPLSVVSQHMEDEWGSEEPR